MPYIMYFCCVVMIQRYIDSASNDSNTIFFETNGKYAKCECQVSNSRITAISNIPSIFHQENLSHGIPYIDKILIQKQWNDFVFYNNI